MYNTDGRHTRDQVRGPARRHVLGVPKRRLSNEDLNGDGAQYQTACPSELDSRSGLLLLSFLRLRPRHNE